LRSSAAGNTSSPLDSSGSGAHFGAAQTATCAAPDAAAGDLIVFIATWNGGSGTLTVGQTLKDSSGATVTPNTAGGPGPNPGGVYFTFAWGIAGSAGGTADTGTATLSQSDAGAAGIASFLAAAGGSAHTATAAATVTPASTLTQVHNHGRAVAATVTPATAVIKGVGRGVTSTARPATAITTSGGHRGNGYQIIPQLLAMEVL
jgi:hypothetical protein